MGTTRPCVRASLLRLWFAPPHSTALGLLLRAMAVLGVWVMVGGGFSALNTPVGAALIALALTGLVMGGGFARLGLPGPALKPPGHGGGGHPGWFLAPWRRSGRRAASELGRSLGPHHPTAPSDRTNPARVRRAATLAAEAGVGRCPAPRRPGRDQRYTTSNCRPFATPLILAFKRGVIFQRSGNFNANSQCLLLQQPTQPMRASI
jgi:hypothetical protein